MQELRTKCQYVSDFGIIINMLKGRGLGQCANVTHSSLVFTANG